MAGKLYNLFYGTPAQTIAKWCLVTLNTAYAYKRGDRKPSDQVTRLFMLHRQGRVLGSEWEGWKVHGDKLVDPEGNITTQGQLRAYYLVYQLCRELSQDREDGKERMTRILREAAG